jgi:hypothetical protein
MLQRVQGIRFKLVHEDGEVALDELVITDVDLIERVEKGFVVLGQRGRIVIEFDPPVLVAPPIDVEDE